MGRRLAGCAQGREKKGEERGCGPPVGGEKEREGEEKGGQLGWAQRKREGEGKRKQNQKAFEFEH
jgi:hypothetical protein